MVLNYVSCAKTGTAKGLELAIPNWQGIGSIYNKVKNPELRSCGPLFEILGSLVVLSCSKKVIIQMSVENSIG